jgi:hypothetical protein
MKSITGFLPWRRAAATFVVLAASCLLAQPPAPGAADPLKSLSFLEGEWSAATPGGANGPSVIGAYTFRKELAGHILARHSSSASCKGPADFDCDHGDLLYVYFDGPAQALKAIYFDNEGHVIHYKVSTPTSSSVIFLSDPSVPGPQFRLTYNLKDTVMAGKFQMQMPGQREWKSYLEWSGSKK